MAVKRYKPTSPARRFMTVPSYEELSGDKPERSLLEDQRKSGGRNNAGRITVRHIGGGNKRKYRIIDFKRNKDGVIATVRSQPQRKYRAPRVCGRRKEIQSRSRRLKRRG